MLLDCLESHFTISSKHSIITYLVPFPVQLECDTAQYNHQHTDHRAGDAGVHHHVLIP